MTDGTQSSNLGVLTQRVLESPVTRDFDDPFEMGRVLGIPATGASVLVMSVYLKACSGDVNAAKLIREMSGEVGEISGELQDFSHIPTETLIKYAQSIIGKN